MNRGSQRNAWRTAVPWIVLPVAMALVTVLARGSGANVTTAGFLYLITVLILTAWGGWAAGAAASVAATLDLRTPLTSMRLEIESLQRYLTDRPEALESLQGLALEQGRLSRRIDNLLALARLEAGLARPHPEAMPPGDLLRAVRESLVLALAGRSLETRIAPRCPDLWVDPSLTLEIVVNLLENAARLAPPERPLELAAYPAAGRVCVEVLDRGPGVPPAIKRMLQSPLELRREGGSGDSVSGGLGLQIARSFAEVTGGTLSLLDRPGGGAIARLDLPAAPDVQEVEE